jgi:hypothetical protein
MNVRVERGMRRTFSIQPLASSFQWGMRRERLLAVGTGTSNDEFEGLG